MASDKRYGLVKALFKVGETYTFDDIFDIVPKTVISKDLGMNYHTFTRKTEDPERFTLQEIIRMSQMFKIDPQVLCERVFMSVELRRRQEAQAEAEMEMEVEEDAETAAEGAAEVAAEDE